MGTNISTQGSDTHRVSIVVSFSAFQIGKVQVWMKTLQSYEYAVAFLNEDDYGMPKNVTVQMGSLGIATGIYDVQDIFINKDFMDFSTDDKFSILVPPEGCRLLHLYPSELRHGRY